MKVLTKAVFGSNPKTFSLASLVLGSFWLPVTSMKNLKRGCRTTLTCFLTVADSCLTVDLHYGNECFGDRKMLKFACSADCRAAHNHELIPTPVLVPHTMDVAWQKALEDRWQTVRAS